MEPLLVPWGFYQGDIEENIGLELELGLGLGLGLELGLGPEEDWYKYQAIVEPGLISIVVNKGKSFILRLTLMEGLDAAGAISMLLNGSITFRWHGASGLMQLIHPFIEFPMTINNLILDEMVRVKHITGIREHTEHGVDYLDIPLMCDFFMYDNHYIPPYEIRISYPPIYAFDKAYIIPQSVPTKLETITWSSSFYMTSTTTVLDILGDQISCQLPNYTKLIFITLLTDLEELQYPEFTVRITDYGKASYDLDPTYFFVKEYNSMCIYGICPNPEIDMRNWINVIDEPKNGLLYPPTGNLAETMTIIFNDCQYRRILVDILIQLSSTYTPGTTYHHSYFTASDDMH